jgi:hypothetical protein
MCCHTRPVRCLTLAPSLGHVAGNIRRYKQFARKQFALKFHSYAFFLISLSTCQAFHDHVFFLQDPACTILALTTESLPLNTKMRKLTKVQAITKQIRQLSFEAHLRDDTTQRKDFRKLKKPRSDKDARDVNPIWSTSFLSRYENVFNRQQACRLFSLPAELRIHVYGYCFALTDKQSAKPIRYGLQPRMPLGLRLTCRRIDRDSADIWATAVHTALEQSTLWLDTTGMNRAIIAKLIADMGSWTMCVKEIHLTY